jgi:hypothetical protein
MCRIERRTFDGATEGEDTQFRHHDLLSEDFFRNCESQGPDQPVVLSNVVTRLLFKEGLIYEQSAQRTLRELQEKRPSKCARQPL